MNNLNKIKVLIVDDHEMVRIALCILFETFDDFEVVGHTADGEFALALCRCHQPDVVLTDLIMPRMDGVTLIRQIHSSFPAIAVIIITCTIENAIIQDALEAGASGCILKMGRVDEMAQAVREVYTLKPS